MSVEFLVLLCLLSAPILLGCDHRCKNHEEGQERCRGFIRQVCSSGHWRDEGMVPSKWSPRIDPDRCKDTLKSK